MSKKLYWIFVGIIFVFTISLASASDKLSELQKLKAENFKLKNQLLQCQVSASNDLLSKERFNLIEEFRQTIGATNEEVFDWNTLTFTKSSK